MSATTTQGATFAVHFGNIITTNTWIASVYEKSAGLCGRSHSSFFTGDKVRDLLNDQWPGAVASRALPADVDAIPVGEARFAACDKVRAERAILCERAIRAAFPEIADKMRFHDCEGEMQIAGSTDALRASGYADKSQTRLVTLPYVPA